MNSVSKAPVVVSDEYRKNYDRIFKATKKKPVKKTEKKDGLH
jgi:hypothetical protein